MLTGTVTVKVKYKGEKDPRKVEVNGAFWPDEDAIKRHFETSSPGCEFMGIVEDSQHNDDQTAQADKHQETVLP